MVEQNIEFLGIWHVLGSEAKTYLLHERLQHMTALLDFDVSNLLHVAKCCRNVAANQKVTLFSTAANTCTCKTYCHLSTLRCLFSHSFGYTSLFH